MCWADWIAVWYQRKEGGNAAKNHSSMIEMHTSSHLDQTVKYVREQPAVNVEQEVRTDQMTPTEIILLHVTLKQQGY